MKKKMILSFTLITLSQGWADISENDGILPHYTKQRSNTNQLGEILQYRGHGPIQTHPTLSIEQRLLLAYGQAIREMVLNALNIPNLSQNEVQQATLPTVIKNVITDVMKDTTIMNNLNTLQDKSQYNSQSEQKIMFNLYIATISSIDEIIKLCIPAYAAALNTKKLIDAERSKQSSTVTLNHSDNPQANGTPGTTTQGLSLTTSMNK